MQRKDLGREPVMNNDAPSMESLLPSLQQHLGRARAGFLRAVLPSLLAAAMCAHASGGQQSFAVALPELEGPVTMGIFSSSGERVRLLCRDAGVDTIPAGLNGLIMSWDGKDDQGRDVPAGTYRARALVHGPLRITALPVGNSLPIDAAWREEADLFPLRPPFPKNRITIRAAKDELLESRPLLSIEACIEGDACVIRAEGLPLLSIPMESAGNVSPVITHGPGAGTASITIDNPKCSFTHTISGLDRLVPLNAGALEIPADAFHPLPGAGESAP
jgi:hypothetical protein